MNQAEKQLATKIFAAYYEVADFKIPSPGQREFGIGNIKKIDARHLNFANLQEFRRYLTTNTPMFVSHSTAYYDFPGATPMQRKGLRGADLVFDLDIHAEGKYGAYAQLDRVKEDLMRLVRDFIISDFGCKDVLVAFSGNRGYHVHVRDKDFLPLGGEERRELVDYVMGTGLNYLDFFTYSDTKPARLLGPVPKEGGYRGRFARATASLLDTQPAKISRLFSNDAKRSAFLAGINEGNWSKTSLGFEDLKKRLGVVAETLPVSSVDTDAGVTQDLSKLIRVPNSIHGETGLVAKILDPSESMLGSFDPLNDALLPRVDLNGKIRFLEDVPALEIGGGTEGPFKKDEEKEFARKPAVALFYLLKGSATMTTR